ncbi:COG1470 family protein [Streptomyces sp. NPDC054961]
MPVHHTPRRRAAHLLGAAAAAAALLGATTTAATADEPGWTAEPVAGSAPAAPPKAGARPYFYLAGTSGTVLEDRLALDNTSDRDRTITLRGADAYNTAGGAFAVRSAQESKGAGVWISFGAGTTVKVPAHTRAVVPFTVTVPPDSPPGDHPAAVVATEAGHEVGVRVHLRVGGPTLAALTVEDVSVRGKGASARVAYTLVNRGNVALTPELSVRADGAFGKVAGRGAHPVAVEVLPGQRVELTEPWPGAPVFDRVALDLTVTAPGGARATGSTSRWFLPWGIAGRTGVGLLGLGATTAAALFLVRKRRTRDGDGGPPRRGTAVPDQSAAPEHELTGASR